MQKLTLLIVMTISLFCQKVGAQSKAQNPVKAEIEDVDIISLPGFPDANGQIITNALDVIIKFKNPQLAGKVLVNVKPKSNTNAIIQAQEVELIEKDGAIYYKIGNRERALKRGAALVNFFIDDFTPEQVSIEILLFDKVGLVIDSQNR